MVRVFINWVFLLGFFSISLSQTSFEIGLNSEEDCKVWEANIDNNGSVILVGNIGPYIGLDYDAFVIKVNPDGDYITKRFDLLDTLSVFSTVEILDNGNYFIIGSYSLEENYLQRDNLWIVILDEELNLISERSYQIREPYVGFGTSACSLIDNDGNIVLAAIAGDEDSKEKTIFADFAFYKFNQQGDTLVSKYYSYIWDELPWELRQMPNSDNIMLIERCTYYNNHNELLFIDTDLNILKINNWATIDMDGDVSSDFWCTDTSFLVSGRGSWNMDGYYEYFINVYLMDTSANIHQELVLNKNDTIDYSAWRNSMAYANDSTIYIGGFQNPFGFWLTDPTIVELYVIDKNMNLLGYKELGGDANYEVWGIIATDDDGCLIYGTSYTNDSVPERDVHIWKVLREEINIITKITETNQNIPNFDIYPNPAVNEVNLKLNKNKSWDNLTFSIFTIDGKKVFQKQIQGKGNMLNINISNLSEGIYVYRIFEKNNLITNGKFIKK
ncbi:MAG: T9SS type A sorting domain-containing protein [Bacteroidetes bacterium]|nr:T9SS type A sorting domain-containing protein [Bacteroidota bacterium]MBL7105314.1 T9SS type A sorting domain-containing protein [Bacteroidales bacterium]